MPNINIKEIDSTTADEVSYNDYVVLIPGKASTGGHLTAVGDEAEISTTKDFIIQVGQANLGTVDDSYKMAFKLLSLGMTVHYVIINNAADLTDAFYTKYQDKGKYDLRFITSGGYASAEIATRCITCAATRGDAVAILDVPEDVESGDVFDTANIELYTASLAAVSVTRSDGTVEDGMKYAAIFSPKVTYSDGMTLPASTDYLSCFAKYISTYQPWFAMAGSVRGVSPQSIASLSVDFGDADVSVLQSRSSSGEGTSTSSHKACNVICEIKPYGKVVWGNRTLLQLGTGLVASSFLNIRQLCCSLKKTLYRAGRKFTFEPNSDVLWINFTNAITPLLEEMKSGQGIKGYTITQEATTAKATLKAKIRIIPIEAVEDFDLTVELTDSIVVTE